MRIKCCGWVLCGALLLCLTACKPASTPADSSTPAISTTTSPSLSTTRSEDALVSDETNATSAVTGGLGTTDTTTDISVPGESISMPSGTVDGTALSSSPSDSTAVSTSDPAGHTTGTANSTGTSTAAVTPPTQGTPVTGTIQPLDPAAYYGLCWLKTQPNSDTLVAAYHRMVEGVKNMKIAVSLRDAAHPITVEELAVVYQCYRRDYPQHFWLGNGYSISYTSQNDKQIVLEWLPKTENNEAYLITTAEKNTAQAKWDRAVKEALNGVTASMTAYERELKIHDNLIARCAYDETQESAYCHSAYGALVEGKAVCEGYSRAFQYLLYQVGIPCLIAEGQSHGQGHAWNMAQIDGSWYHVDVTWDDPLSDTPSLYHGYLNLNDGWIREDHTVEQKGYPLPAATAIAANYHVKNDTVVSGFSVEDAAARLKKQAAVQLYVTGDVQAYIQDFFDHFNEIVRLSGRSGVLQIDSSGREVQIRVQ
ncbi:MAG: hypothetical protein J6K98_04710 [Clostridia bacterium]|nr:hypothetical protein [Clostridia bacterium]